MTQVSLTVHRSTQSIGGNCIEISTSAGNRLLLDIGRPLDAPREATNLLPESLVQSGTVDGILISHPHQDHYGLLEEAPAHWPVYCGEATGKLIRMTSGIFGKALDCTFRHWQSQQPFTTGPFTITPYLTDHSAYDAYMLQIDVGGKRIFYSGDFRIHGRKASLVQRLMASPPPDIDVLLMEGTNLGSNKPCMTEDDLEQDYVKLFRNTNGRVFVSWSAQNIDRTVTLFRACKKTSRTLVIDLYTAEVLELLARQNRIPMPDWQGIKVVVTRSFANLYKKTGRDDFVKRMAKNGIAARDLNNNRKQWVIMTRPSLIKDYEYNNVAPDANDAWSWGLWSGYLKNEDGMKIQQWFDNAGSHAAHIHTSGHASPDDLRLFANSMQAKTMVPIHGLAWDEAAEGFPPISRLRDNQPLIL